MSNNNISPPPILEREEPQWNGLDPRMFGEDYEPNMNAINIDATDGIMEAPPLLEREEPQWNGLDPRMFEQNYNPGVIRVNDVIEELIIPKGADEPKSDNTEELGINEQNLDQIGDGRQRKRFYQDPTHHPSEYKRRLIGNDQNLNKKLDIEQFQGTHFKCLDAVQATTGQYKGFRFLGTFELDEPYKTPYPEQVLIELFQLCLDYVQNSAEEIHLNPNRYIISIDSKTLDYEIFLHLSNINQNSPLEILNKFEKCDQSNRAKGNESVLTGLFHLDITAYELNEGRRKKNKHPGSGKPRRLQPIHFKINEKALYKIEDDGPYCLFRAVTTAMKKSILTKQRFHEFQQDEAMKQNAVWDLLYEEGIDRKRLFYDIEDFGDKIQNYLDRKYPGRFKLFAFENDGRMGKPFWQSKIGMFDYQEPLCIFYWKDEEGGHYDAIKTMNQLFSGKENYPYCYACEMPYKEHKTHRTRCKHKCKNCTRVGPKFPCKNTGFHRFCAGCSKVFTNFDCFWHHVDKDICFKSKKCHNCEVVYRIDVQQRHQRQHICYEKFCRRCLGYHKPRNCYIRPYKQPGHKDFRYIFMDTESMIGFQPDPKLLRFLHETNFIWAYVTCSRCINLGRWDKELKTPCEICGINRLYAWAPFDFQGTKCDSFTKTDDPMSDFVDWAINFEQRELKMQKGGDYVMNKIMGEIPDEDEEISDEEDDQNKDEEDQPKKKPIKQTSFNSIIYAHAGSKYDNLFAFRKILQEYTVVPKLIRNGNRLYQMKVSGKDLTTTIFRDSFHLIPIRLAKFVDTFGLDIETKKFFPYHYNKEENYNITLDGLPPEKDYGVGSMSPAELEEFRKWYNENKDKIKFNLNDQLADYCSNDVKILVHGMIKMKQLFEEVTGHDLFRSITIPSACMRVFRSGLKWNHLAMTPHMGYEHELHGKQQSAIGRKYLKWYQFFHGLKLKTADNGGEELYEFFYETEEGELRKRRYWLDGYLERPGEKGLAIEVNGCFWHACPHCFPDDDKVLAGGTSAKVIRENNARRMDDLLKKYDVKVVWECEILKMLESTQIYHIPGNGQNKITTMQAFFDEIIDTGPIELHDAFFGGRTGPEAMVSNAKKLPNRAIKYRDFKSLYPFINWSTKYPIKHPEWSIFDVDVDWRSSRDIVDPYGRKIEGIVKCFVVPPRHTLHNIPVLPTRINKSLVFATCHKCAIKFTNPDLTKIRWPNYQCPHFEDEDRGYAVTTNTMELEMALDAGYRVTRIYRCYNWPGKEDWDSELFHPYMRIFMKLKYEAEGWPKNCTEEGISEEERENRKMEYMANARRLYGIILDPAKIVKNPGMRFIAKLCLNSLWGRFALRNRLSVSVIVNNPADLAEIFNDDTKEVILHDHLDQRNILICYRTKNEYVREHDASNLIVALWTTAGARVHLLKHLYKAVKNRPDVQILYMDTDSIIYEFDETLGDPLAGEREDQLGDLADEYPGHDILEFISTAPKAYCIWMKDKNTNEDNFIWRMKGIPLTADIKNKLAYDRYKEMAELYGHVPEELVTETFTIEKNFRSTRSGEIATVPMDKKFRPFINKGIILNPGKIVPYGWSDPKWCSEHNPNNCSCKI